MTKTCPHCAAKFEITEDDLAFYKKVSPVFAGKTYQIPPPTLCPDCRSQRRLSWRNERTLYTRKCDLCKKDMVSLYAPNSTFPIYCADCWWSDKWDPLAYGKPFDPGMPFLDQLRELQAEVPRLTLFNSNSENSDYSNHAARNKNCYLVFASFDGENNYYGRGIKYNSKDTMDCETCIRGCQFCYECIQCVGCYNLQFAFYCRQCSDSFFLYDCSGCSDCYRCYGLRNKKYCIENREYSKEEYQKLLPDLGSYKVLKQEKEKFLQFIKTKPHRYANFINCQDCTGDDLIYCKNSYNCYDMQDCENCKNIEIGEDMKDSQDCYGVGFPAELLYEVHGMLHGYHSIACHASYFDSEIYYCDICQNSKNLFGCVGLKKREYCILNKQYSKDEHEKLVGEIISQMQGSKTWGEFFPSSISPWAYNETQALEYFPLTKEEAIKQGFKWTDYTQPQAATGNAIHADKLPDNIKDVNDDILKTAIECEITNKPFKIIKPELEYYRVHNLPIPRRHPEQRNRDRQALQNPSKLWKRNCAKCNAAIETSFAPERPEIVYCEQCYLKEVY